MYSYCSSDSDNTCNLFEVEFDALCDGKSWASQLVQSPIRILQDDWLFCSMCAVHDGAPNEGPEMKRTKLNITITCYQHICHVRKIHEPRLCLLLTLVEASALFISCKCSTFYMILNNGPFVIVGFRKTREGFWVLSRFRHSSEVKRFDINRYLATYFQLIYCGKLGIFCLNVDILMLHITLCILLLAGDYRVGLPLTSGVSV